MKRIIILLLILPSFLPNYIGQVTICNRISSSIDDVEENGNNGSVYTNSSDIELISDGGRGNQIIGLRYPSLSIPQGAIIASAYLQFTTDETNTGTCNLLIHGEDIDNSSAFTSTINNVSNRNTTTASASWNPPNWNTVGQSDSDQQSSDLTTIIQEIVDRTGYNSSSAISLIITGSGERTAESFDGSASQAAQLCITYTSPKISVCAQISSSIDDVEENGNNGSVYTNSSDIELISDGGRGNQIIGLRYPSLSIPQGAIIASAYLQFTTDETNTGTCNLLIHGEDIDNSSAFTSTINNVSNRNTTTASASWNPPNWNTVGQSDSDQQSSDLTTIIQEIVDRTGYNSSSAISLIITGSGERTAESFDGSATQAARLCIVYELPSFTWTAETLINKTDWFDGGNWSSGTSPTLNNSIIIPTNPTGGNFFPNINSPNAACKDLTIQTGGELTISGSNTLDIYGLWSNNGMFTPNLSTVNFLGFSAQTISSSSAQTFYNISLKNSFGLNVSNGNLELKNTLTLTNGLFDTGNLVTLISDAIGTASIEEITGGSIIGNITMQRYVDAGATNWRFITSAIAGATLADLNDDFETSGFPGSDFPNWPTAANPWPSIYSYDETQPGAQDEGLIPVTNISNSFGTGKGYWVWSGDTVTGTQPFTIDITGPPNVGTLNMPLSFTNTGNADDGWNMSGNPYPSTLNWDSPNITKTNINNAIYIWNPDNQQFASYVAGIGTNGGSRNITSSQAFYVQANNSGASIQVTEASKTSIDGSFLRPAASFAPLRIKTENAYGNDELVINFEPAATSNFDANYDAEKIASSNIFLPKTSSSLNGVDYSINQIDPQEISIPVKILTGVTDSHTIRIENAYDFNPSSCLILEDLFTNISYNLSLVDSFTTVIYDTTQSARFSLHIGAPIDLEKDDISCFGNVDAKIVFTKKSSNTFDIIWKDQSNTIISSATNVALADSLMNLNAGTYYIITTDALCGNHIDTVITNEPAQISANFNSDEDTVYLSNGGVISLTNLSANATTFSWDFDDLNTSNLVSPTHQYETIGDYLITLNAAQSSNCFETISKNITVLDFPTDIVKTHSINELKVWVKDNTLLIKGTKNSTVHVRNILGQKLFNASNDKEYSFDLSKLSSQILIVNINSNNTTSSKKVHFVKNN